MISLSNQTKSAVEIMQQKLLQYFTGDDKTLGDKLALHLLANPGKRIRARIVLALQDILQNLNVDLAAAIELIHGASLVHDDVIDHSTMRRNHVTTQYIAGNRAAVLTGDYMMVMAFDIIQNVSHSLIPSTLHFSFQLVRSELTKMHETFSRDYDQYIKMIDGKTSSLFQLAFQFGLFKSEYPLDSLNSWALRFGRLFQMQDDYLDFWDLTKRGKDTGEDFSEHIFSLPVAMVYTYLSADEIQHYQSIQDFQSAKQWLEKKGIQDKCVEKITVAKNNLLHEITQYPQSIQPVLYSLVNEYIMIT